MKKINFSRNVNFWELASFGKVKSLENTYLLNEAFDQNVLIEDNKGFLKKFINHFEKKKNISSQLYQDMFASFIVGNKFDKTFLEFGATNGIDLSNTYMLENLEKWWGALSEPSLQWHEALKKNRKNSKIITKCIWSQSGKI